MKAPQAALDSVTVRVPASTSNLGPGFDTLGLALTLYNTTRVTRRPGKGVLINSPLDPDKRANSGAMLNEAATHFFRAARTRPFGIEVVLGGDIPIARGLGSSVTIRLGVVAGLNEMCGRPLDRQRMLDIVAGLEHHPDNAAPAVFGGFTVAGFYDGRVQCFRFPVSQSLKFVTLIPQYEVAMAKARQLVPPTFSRADTVHNLNRTALLTAGFAS